MTEHCGLPVFVWPRPGFEIPLVKQITNNSLIRHDIGVILSVVNVNLLIKIWCRMQVAMVQLGSLIPPCLRWLVLMTHESFISEKRHENLRKFSEIFGNFFPATCQLRNISFIYSIKISAILNLSLGHSSQITFPHPHIPVSLAISILFLAL